MKKSFFNKNIKYICLFPIAIILGAIFVNFAGIELVKKWDILTPDFGLRMLSVDIDFTTMFLEVFLTRIKYWIVICVLFNSYFEEYMPNVICGYCGIATGIIASSLCMQYGLKYLWIFATGVVCHGSVYIFSIYFICLENFGKSRYFMSLLIWVIGILLESFIYYRFMPGLLL